jgi:dienelactone hydrolase
MPGLVIVHSHHTPNTQGELQDMGMTWARSGCAVLVPELLGHGERRQHRFTSEKDYPKPFRPSRQDYYFRYNSALQLSLIGESLMGWFVWDLMRGVDVLLKQPGIDPSRIIMLGAVAGGGDPAGVTAALDPRIACVVPFNFSGWQPESNAPPDPDRDFAWFGEGYWETTRGLKGGAAGGFAHYVITGSIAPRKLIYAHEFKWDPNIDPAWPRLRKIYGFYDAKDRLSFAHGAGKVTGQGGPENTHCTHIGAVHRKMIYPALKQWFDMPVPEEYSKRRSVEELTCWTDAAKAELKPKLLHQVLNDLAPERLEARFGKMDLDAQTVTYRREIARLLGNTEPGQLLALEEGKPEAVPGGMLARFIMAVEPGIVVPFLLLTPKDAKGKTPVVVMVAQGGKSGFLRHRAGAIEVFLKAGAAVCLLDVRGTGETSPADRTGGRGSTRTSISQTSLILGQPVLGAQLRDLRTVIRWLQVRNDVDAREVVVWGDSFAETNPFEVNFAVPLDAPDLPVYAEPGGATLAQLSGCFPEVKHYYARGGLASPLNILESPYTYVPHDSIFAGGAVMSAMPADCGPKFLWRDGLVDGRNRPLGKPLRADSEVARSIVKFFDKK